MTSGGTSANRQGSRATLRLVTLQNALRRTALEAVSSRELAVVTGTGIRSSECALGGRTSELRDRLMSGGSRAGRPGRLAQGALPCVSGCTALKAVANGMMRGVQAAEADVARGCNEVVDDVGPTGGCWSAQAKTPGCRWAREPGCSPNGRGGGEEGGTGVGIKSGAAGGVRLAELFAANRFGRADGGDAARLDARRLCGQAEGMAEVSGGEAVARRKSRKFFCWRERVGPSRDRHRATTWNVDRIARCEPSGRRIAQEQERRGNAV